MDAATEPLNACLYRRMGGAAGIATMVDGMVDRHAANPLLARRFRDCDLPQLKAQSVAFFSTCLGASCPADRSNSSLAHAGMQFDGVELAAVIEDIGLTLEENGLDAADIAALTALLSPSRVHHPSEQAREHEQFRHDLRTGEANAASRQSNKETDMSQATTTTLYDRLGRRDGITRITRELIKNHLANPLVNRRYAQIEDMDRVERNVIDFFCAGAGGPETYHGKDLVATHRGMNVNEQEFVAVIDDAMAALETCDVDLSTRNEVLAILWSMKAEVIRI
ncbi:group I truncated hemoglobin [Lacisediminimonas profundi]|uniref:group I truncated hemoglobin n=1 Tax=Lacisediminimonas profundi TaxID=2603856 RepID=UPI0019D638A0|nr:group 1 truncated hemoglobin [Lacisediminimonas profundi]